MWLRTPLTGDHNGPSLYLHRRPWSLFLLSFPPYILATLASPGIADVMASGFIPDLGTGGSFLILVPH